MKDWDQEFLDHPVHENLENLINKVSNYKRDDKDLNVFEQFSRIKESAIFVRNRFDTVLGSIAPRNVLNAINDSISNTHGEIDNFSANKNIAHLQNANDNMDGVISRVTRLPRLETTTDASSFARQASEFREKAKFLIAETKEDKKEVDTRISGLNENVVGIKQQIQQLEQAIQQQKINLEKISANFQNQFSQGEDRRRAEFQTQIQEQNNIFEDELEEIKGKINEWQDANKVRDKAFAEELSQQSQQIIHHLEKQKGKVGKLVGIIGNTGLTGNYKAIADKERTSANWLRGAAFFFMLCASAVLGITVWQVSVNGLTWQQSLIRVLIGFLIGAPSTYLAMESAKHRNEEKRNRHIEQELSAIDPYIEDLPEQEKTQLKIKLADLVFTKMSADVKEEDPVIAQDAIIKLLLETLKKTP